MGKIDESILQLQADLEELKEYSEKSATEFVTTHELVEKVFLSIQDRSKSEIRLSDYKPMIILLEEHHKKLMESMRSEARIITRVSPKLESYFEDWLLDYEKQYDAAFQILKSTIEEGISENKIKEYHQKMKNVNLTGHIVQDNIKISSTIIESIMKRLED